MGGQLFLQLPVHLPGAPYGLLDHAGGGEKALHQHGRSSQCLWCIRRGCRFYRHSSSHSSGKSCSKPARRHPLTMDCQDLAIEIVDWSQASNRRNLWSGCLVRPDHSYREKGLLTSRSSIVASIFRMVTYLQSTAGEKTHVKYRATADSLQSNFSRAPTLTVSFSISFLPAPSNNPVSLDHGRHLLERRRNRRGAHIRLSAHGVRGVSNPSGDQDAQHQEPEFTEVGPTGISVPSQRHAWQDRPAPERLAGVGHRACRSTRRT